MIVTNEILIRVTEKGEDGSFCFTGNTLFTWVVIIHPFYFYILDTSILLYNNSQIISILFLLSMYIISHNF